MTETGRVGARAGGPAAAPALVVRPESGDGEWRFDGSRPVRIGRDPNSDVVVADNRVSRTHAVLEPARGGWVLVDQSSNGTFSGGRRLDRLPLDSPVTVQLGNAQGAALTLIPQPRAAAEPVTPPSRAPEGRAPQRPEAPAAPPRQAPAPPRQAPVPPRQPAAAAPVRPPTAAMPGRSATPAAPGGRSAPIPGLGSGSTPWGNFSSVYEPAAGVTKIGRSPDNDIVVEDLLVSRHHAELRTDRGGQRVIVDLGSYNGTFVGGQRVDRAVLTEGATVTLGHHSFMLRGDQLVEFIDDGQVTFSARNLGVTVDGKVLLDDVNVFFGPGTFSAILGPTGAGKSTFLKALTGARPADRGRVLYNGRNLYGAFGELRDRIGYVPQDDILHVQLTARQALRYAAQLRFPADVSDTDREARIDQVLEQLGLGHRADLAISRLSGGQRKRTSVALELLTRPSLLMLDEPTSGLDPGYEKSVMELLRSLADDGRTVLTVTHSVQSLNNCDRVLFLAPGGTTAFFGPPQEALEFFGQHEYADVFLHLDGGQPGTAHAKFLGSPAEKSYVEAPLAANPAPAETGAPTAPEPPKASSSWTHQLKTLVSRYTAVIAADRRNLLLLLAQAPVLAVLILAVTGHNSLVPPVFPHRLGTKASTLLIALVLGATYLGAGNSIREVVKERALLERERAVGLSPVSYVLSKVVVLGGLTVIQAAILDIVGTLRAGGPAHGALLGSGRLELFLVLAGAGLSAMALGLLISAFASNADKALTLLPVLLFVQFLLSGALFNINNTPGLEQLGYLTSAKWGYSAAASTANLETIEGGCGAQRLPVSIARCDSSYTHGGGTWVGDMVALGLLFAVPTGGAVVAVRRLGRPRKD